MYSHPFDQIGWENRISVYLQMLHLWTNNDVTFGSSLELVFIIRQQTNTPSREYLGCDKWGYVYMHGWPQAINLTRHTCWIGNNVEKHNAPFGLDQVLQQRNKKKATKRVS